MSRIERGDCVEIMAKLPSGKVDFVLTDPPYLVDYHDRSGRSIANDKDDAWLRPAFAQISRLLKHNSLCISFYGWGTIDKFMAAWKAAGLYPVAHFVFSKEYASKTRYVQYRHESAYLLAKGNPSLPSKPLPDVLPFKYSGNRLHPTQKPVDAMQTLIECFTKPGDIVMDPFSGSGTTCAAAQACGRRWYGIELDPGHHAVSVARLAACRKQAKAA